MSKVFNQRGLSAVLLVLGAIGSSVLADDLNLVSVPKYETPVPYNGERNWHVTQNLGATGARYWVAGTWGNSAESRELLIKSVEPGSPADGILQPFDVIVGAAVPPPTPSTQWTTAPAVAKFDSDARLSAMRALTWAESDAGQGELKLMMVRAGQPKTVTVKLPVLGTFSATAPYDCPKSDRIVANAAAFLAQNAPAEGYYSLEGAHAAMLLFACGDDRYLDLVRRSAMRTGVNNKVTDGNLENWRWGNMNTFLCEYYLATGDKRVLPRIKDYCDALAAGQCNPGTWGHRGVPDFIPPGYGSLNSAGVVCFLSMILADQAGVDFDKKAVERSIAFYGKYAGIGSIPYGDHAPDDTPTANGKNGMAAVAFYQLYADPAAQWFARQCASANLTGVEGGHTGTFFNQTWSPLGASLAGRRNYQNFWARFNSYRDMARRWDGSFVSQPWTQKREGDLCTINYVSAGPMWSTGGFALSYLAGNNRLAILGRRGSVFKANPPVQLKKALQLYEEKNFDKCIEAASLISADTGLEKLHTYAEQLKTAATRNINSLKLTLEDMDKAFKAGDLYKLKFQLQAIESIIDPEDARLKEYRSAVNDPANQPILEAGKQFYEIVDGPDWTGPVGFQIYAQRVRFSDRSRAPMQKLADNAPGGYRALAKTYLDANPKLHLYPDTPLFDTAAKDAWRLAPAGEKTVDGWTAQAFDDSKWRTITLPDKDTVAGGEATLRRVFDVKDINSVSTLALEYTLNEGQKMSVYLNGEHILDNTSPGWPDVHTMLLTPTTRELLKPAGNCLAVKLSTSKGEVPFKLTFKGLMTPDGKSGQ